MIDFSSNINAFAPFGNTQKVIENNAHLFLSYPDSQDASVMALLAEYFSLHTKNIALGIGSTHILFNIPKFLSYERALILNPTFWEYTVFNMQNNKNIHKINTLNNNDAKNDLEALDCEMKKTDCVFICNVNNPTSKMYQKKDLIRLIKKHPETKFVIDETYLLFQTDFDSQTLMEHVQEYGNLFVVTSLSKFFSIPGVRLGILCGHETHVRSYQTKYEIPYSISPIAYPILKDTLSDASRIKQSRTDVSLERTRIIQILQSDTFKGKVELVYPYGCLVLVRILTNHTSEEIKEKLFERGISIRGGHELIDVPNSYIRFSIRSAEENTTLLDTLHAILK
jgi:threonine-phosphate decarboxylase